MQLHDDALQGQLRRHVEHLAAKIGPRPPASQAEEAAFDYIRNHLSEAGITDRRTLRFRARRSALAALPLPLLTAAAANIPPFPVVHGEHVGFSAAFLRRLLRMAGALVAAGALRVTQTTLSAGRPPALRAGQSSVQLGIIPAAAEPRHRLVLVAHVDTPQVSPTLQAARGRAYARHLGTLLLVAPALNAVAQVTSALFGWRRARRVRHLTAIGMALAGLWTLRESRTAYTPGANANASGVALLLKLALHLAEHPLPHTEVWLAFTGAGTSGGDGVHALLDSYGAELSKAHFLVVNRVGANRLKVAASHEGTSHLTGYSPAPYTLSIADAARDANPVLGVERGPAPGTDETAVLRGRGYNALTLTGYDPITDYPAAYHAQTDTPLNLDYDGLERAYQYVRVFGETLDTKVG
jgi:hypothetical protein